MKTFQGIARHVPMSQLYKVVASVVPEDWRKLDVLALKFNERSCAAYREAHEARTAYQDWMHKLSTYAEDGKIAILESGMDCDGVQYAGYVHIVTATKEAVRKEIDDILDSADGPAYFSLERPSVAQNIRYQSRDRTLEAFEDGHAHSITYGQL